MTYMILFYRLRAKLPVTVAGDDLVDYVCTSFLSLYPFRQ